MNDRSWVGEENPYGVERQTAFASPSGCDAAPTQ